MLVYGIIYLLTSPSGKYYIGQTIQPFNERWASHVCGAKHGVNSCPYLNAAILKYGSDSFHKDIIAEAESKERLDHLEKFWIKMFQSNNPEFGYNLKEGGAHGKHSEETKLKISHTLKENPPTYVRTDEIKKKIGDTIKRLGTSAGANNPMFGKKHSPETKEKIRVARLKYAGEKHPRYGKHLSEEIKDKIRKALMSRRMSEGGYTSGGQ